MLHGKLRYIINCNSNYNNTKGPQFQFFGKMTEFYLLTESVHDGGHPTAALSARCALVTNRETTRHVTDYLCDDWPYCFGLSHSSKRSLCEGARPPTTDNTKFGLINVVCKANLLT